MTENSHRLSTGVYIPESVYREAVYVAGKAMGSAYQNTTGGRWSRMSSAMGDTSRLRDQRLTTYENFLGAITIPWVYQAGSTVAWSYAATDWSIQDTVKNGTVPKTNKKLQALANLLKKPNKFMSGFRLREEMMWHYLLTGNAFCVMDNPDGHGWPTELYLLRPSRVKIKPDPKDYISSFWYEVNGDWVPFDPDNVIWFKRANPMDQYWGMGVIEAGQSSFEKQRAISRTEGNFFNAGARIKGVLTYDGILSDEQELELKEAWRAMDEGQSGEIKTAVLQHGMEYKTIQSDLVANGSGMETLAKMARDEILTMFGVPKQKVGIFEDANYRSIEADSFFQAETMRPLLRDTNFGWTQLASRFDPNWEFMHQEVVVTDYLDKATTAHLMTQGASFTRNEIRKQAGVEPLPDSDPRGEEIMGPTTITVFNQGGPAMPQANEASEGDSEPPQQTHVDIPMDPLPSLVPGTKSLVDTTTDALRLACTCPERIEISGKSRPTSPRDLGICPLHYQAIAEEIRIADKRRYSTVQLRNGYPAENYRGIKGVLGR